jgi:transketolase
MRDELCRELLGRSADERMVFLTGDLGFMALEPLRDAMGPRFINCGVAEQNMVSVAAALSYEGLEAWTYTIAPFCYARAFEQIRNDVSLHGLAVKLWRTAEAMPTGSWVRPITRSRTTAFS